MRKFTAVAVVMMLTASFAGASVISQIIEAEKSSSSDAIDLTGDGGYYWAVWDDDVDKDDNDAYEATDWKSGMSTIEVSANYSSTSPDSHVYGDHQPTDPMWDSGNDQPNTNFNWTDGTKLGAASGFEPGALRYNQVLGFVLGSDYRDNIRKGDDNDTPLDTSDDYPALDPSYPDTLQDYKDAGYEFGTVTIPVPVPVGDSTIMLYFNNRRCSFIVGGELSVDGDAGDTGLTGNGHLSGVDAGAKARFVAQIDVTGSTQAQDLLVTIMGQEVDSDTNRRLNLQAVSVTPEPATMSLLALGGLGVLIRRKRS